MSDITTVWKDTSGDWQVDGADLLAGDDLITATLISLFTDRVAHEDDALPDMSDDPRGWCGDDPDFPIGSRLYLLDRSKRTQDTLQRAQDYCSEALQWMVTDGVVARWDVLCVWQAYQTLAIQVTAFKVDGTVASMNFNWAWQALQ